ncbi:AEC family transporter [Halanaerobium hydrogeniformans]|uniref:Auxin Efflux Carrier n=1 Tax=Halanaerobium hydrogeniformans TaxID=656519 RepID=E4RPZ3_HALHG|nr:AEC family transporter [Halanaerobium hydrogeniformans]ADQ14360.1 Auxin Efflux Carrier [Halanaerobium hydrogeniformans]
MLDDFIFSLSVALPIFLIMLSGFIFRKKRIITVEFIDAANFIIFYLALPIKLFNSVAESSVTENFDIRFIGYALSATIISVIIVYLFSVFFIDEKSKIGAFVHGTFRGNFIYVGFSLMENVTGSIGAKTPLIVAFIIPLYNIIAVLILVFTNPANKAKNQLKSAFKNILTNPFIIAIILGAAASLIDFKLPLILQNTADYFDVLATPLALLTIGATFKIDKLFVDIKSSIFATILKLLILPALAVSTAIAFGFANEEVFLIYVLFGVPSAVVSYVITAAMNGDQDLAASIVMMTTLFSVFSITLFIFLFKVFAIV